MTQSWDVLFSAVNYTSEKFVLMGIQFSWLEGRVYAKYDG